MVIFSAPAVPVYDRPTIVILGTGGTIACTADEKDGVLSPSAEKMQDIINEIARHDAAREIIFSVELTYIALLDKDSSEINHDDVQILSSTITQLLKNSQVKAIIVTHGTDTMEESSYLIDITVMPDKPVIFTGAMYAPEHALSDGMHNLLASLKDALQLKNGTWIRMGDNLIPAQGAMKTAYGFISQPDTIATVRIPAHIMSEQNLRRDNVPQIPIITCTQGQSARLISTILEQSDALILKAMGSGNISPDMESLVISQAQDKVIAVVSRVWNAHVHGGYTSGALLQRSGIILCNYITDIQLRILIMELISHGLNRAEIHDFLCQTGIAVASSRNYPLA